MKTPTHKTPSQLRNICLIALLLTGAVAKTNAATVGVDPGAAWIGYMNVFALPGAGNYPPNLGGFQFGSPWGTADLMATFSGPVLTLRPNSIGDPNAYWYTPSGGPGATGNKIMDANMYVEPAGSLPGQTVTFTGNVLANSLVGSMDANGNGWTSVAFIKDFAPDFSSFNQQTVALTPGVFSISLATVNDPARHVQYGFETIGPDVWITDNANFGNVQITAVPEPTTAVLLIGGIASLALLRRNKSRPVN